MGRQTISNKTPAIGGVNDSENAGYESLVQLNIDAEQELSVLVGGVHCAGCIQKIESSLKRLEGIKNVRLNFSTGRLSIVWDGDKQNANEYVALIENLGYNVKPYDPDTQRLEMDNQERFLLLCLGVSGFAMGNLMLLSVGLWSTTADIMGMATRDFMHWVSAVIALPTILFSGRPFFRSALKALSNGHTNMDVPISLALILAGGMSVHETITHGEHVYFDSAVMLMFFLLIGRYLDFRARKNARSTATDLLSTLSGFANVVDGDEISKTLIRDLHEDMIVRVAVGEKIPVDGVVMDGESQLDTSLITGETLPRDVSIGQGVFAGTINLASPITIRVAKAAEDSLLADIVRLMEKAGQGQAKYVRLADKAAKLYTPIVHTFAALAFLGWLFIGGLDWQDSLLISITVLIITCPCALALAVPVVQVLASGKLMKAGILIKSGDALERLATVDTVLLDKTGTLTLGEPVLEGSYDDETLCMAASLASHSNHPLSKAVVRSFKGSLRTVSKIEEIAGRGVEGVFDGKNIRLGSRAWCGDKGASPTNKLELWLSVEGQRPALLCFSDVLREDSSEVIACLVNAGLNPIMLSGDRMEVAKAISKECGIKEFYAEKTPTQKFEILENLKAKGHKVLMVGDGLNDAPVLAGADVSIAPGSAIDMAQNAADIVFMGDRLAPIYNAYKTAKLTQKLVKQNFAIAVIYNIIAVPLALAGLVTPMIAAIAMSGSSLIVIANSFRLRGRGT